MSLFSACASSPSHRSIKSDLKTVSSLRCEFQLQHIWKCSTGVFCSFVGIICSKIIAVPSMYKNMPSKYTHFNNFHHHFFSCLRNVYSGDCLHIISSVLIMSVFFVFYQICMNWTVRHVILSRIDFNNVHTKHINEVRTVSGAIVK